MRMCHVCLLLIAVFAMAVPAYADVVTLQYAPEIGHQSSYNLEITTKAEDKAGFIVETIYEAGLVTEITDVKTEDKNIAGVTVKVLREAGTFTLRSGENERVEETPEGTLTLSADRSGKILEVVEGDVTSAIIENLTSIYNLIGSEAAPRPGQEWTVDTSVLIQGEMVPAKVTYTLTGLREAHGDRCIVITSRSKIAHKMEGSEVRSVALLWTGEALYSSKSGRLAEATVTGDGSAIMADRSEARVTFAMSMMPKAEEQASLPVRSGILGGITAPPASMMFLLLIVSGVAFAATRLRTRIISHALVASIALALVITGMPVAPATGSGSGVLALSNIANQLASGALGLSAAAGTGIGMGGTRAGSLGVAYAVAPTQGVNVAGAFAAVGAEFVLAAGTGAGAPVGATAAAGGTVLTGTNLLIGGGALAVGGGTWALLDDGSSSSSSSSRAGAGPGPVVPYPNKTTTVANAQLVYSAPQSVVPEAPYDRFDVYFNGNLIWANIEIGPAANGNAIVPVVMGANELRVECVFGGDNQYGAIRIRFQDGPYDPSMDSDVFAPEGQSAVTTITRVDP